MRANGEFDLIPARLAFYLGDLDTGTAQGASAAHFGRRIFLVGDILSDRQARALTFGLENPLATRFWTGVTDAIGGASDFTRKLYTGNGQTYAVQVVFFVVAVYLVAMGGL